MERPAQGEGDDDPVVAKSTTKVNKKSFSEMDEGEKQLEWLELNRSISLKEDGSPHTESGKAKFRRKFGENPLIPVGAVLTTLCLTLGLGGFLTNRRPFQQRMMRGRVFAQGFTVFAMVGSVLYNLSSRSDSSKDTVSTKI